MSAKVVCIVKDSLIYNKEEPLEVVYREIFKELIALCSLYKIYMDVSDVGNIKIYGTTASFRRRVKRLYPGIQPVRTGKTISLGEFLCE